MSRLNQTLTQQFDTWRQRPLQQHWRVLYLDGIHFSIRHGDKADSTIILTGLGVDLAGHKEVLALRACAEDDKDGWSCLLQDLRTRGATQMDLIVTDGHDGLLAAVSALFSATPRQRCVVHKQRNVLNAIPHRERKEVSIELAGIFKQEKQADALLIPISVLRDHSKMGEVSHRTETLRVGFQLIESFTHLINHG